MKASPPEAPIQRDLAHTPLDSILTEMLFASRAEYLKRVAQKEVFEKRDSLSVVTAYIVSVKAIVGELKSIGTTFQRKTDSGVPRFYTEDLESWMM